MTKVAGVVSLVLLAVLAAPSAYSSGPLPSAKENRFASNLQYTGGTGMGFTLEQARWGDHRTFERIVLEFAPPRADLNETIPRMKVETEFYPMRLLIRLPGVSARGSNFLSALNIFGKSRLISDLDTYEICEGGQLLAIVPARPVEFEVFTLTSPPRLVVDVILSRMPPMREERKFSVRTLPLYGDQVCLFLKEAANAGVTPRLITDAGGNVFGEVGLYNEPKEAFAAVHRYQGSFGKQFSLVTKARGMMTVPAVMP